MGGRGTAEALQLEIGHLVGFDGVLDRGHDALADQDLTGLRR